MPRSRAPGNGAAARSDLLDYLGRYRATPRRQLRRVERWRRRSWDRAHIVAVADSLAQTLHANGVDVGDRVGIYLKDGPPWVAALMGVFWAGGTAVPIDVAHPPDLVVRLAQQLDLTAWLTDAELPRVALDLPQFELGWNGLVLPVERNAGAGEQRPERASSDADDDERTGGPSTAAPPLPPDEPERVAQVVLTSGTTQLPQSVEVRHENFRAVLDAMESEIDAYRWLIRVAPRLRIATTLPFSHLYGQFMGVFLPVALDADVAVLDAMPAAELAATIRRERAWVLASVPHTLSALLHHLLDEGRRLWGTDELERRLETAASLPWPRRWLLFGKLRRRLGRRLVAVISGGAPLDPELEGAWRRLGYLVIQGYGLTEAAAIVTLNHPFGVRERTIGKPLPGVDVRLADDGEILVRGRNVAQPGEHGPRIDAEGWLYTGDIGELLEDGSIRFLGRRSDRIVTPAGVNVDLADVAAALRSSPELVDVAVVERPWGDSGGVCAVLVTYPGADVDSIVRATNETLPDAARVRAWYVWPYGDLPRTPTGKVRRGDVLAWLRQQAPADAMSAAQVPPTAVAGGEATSHRIDQVLAAISKPGDSDSAGARIGDLLSSLERVELAAQLEDLYDTSLSDDVFAGDRTIAELAEDLASRSGRPSIAGPRGGGARSATPPSRAAPPEERDQGHEYRARRARNEPDLARWRFWLPTRVKRFVLREIVMHPLARLFLRIEVCDPHGAASLRPPFLLAVNHVSVMDPAILFALSLRARGRLAAAARWNYFTEHPRGRLHYFWGVVGLNLFPLVQAGDWRPTLRIAGELADRGYAILIYPEGEISTDGHIRSFQRGVAIMSRDLHLPIVPCATAGLHGVLPRGSHWPARNGIRRRTMAVCFGQPLAPVRPGDEPDAVIAELERRVRALHEEAIEIAGSR
ncbi:MAG: AMP-binding protein [Acidobacteria bacterium]|nr:AMP-binding protein [Acidobacteriota bacterium]